jgi:hypothetical protein
MAVSPSGLGGVAFSNAAGRLRGILASSGPLPLSVACDRAFVTSAAYGRSAASPPPRPSLAFCTRLPGELVVHMGTLRRELQYGCAKERLSSCGVWGLMHRRRSCRWRGFDWGEGSGCRSPAGESTPLGQQAFLAWMAVVLPPEFDVIEDVPQLAEEVIRNPSRGIAKSLVSPLIRGSGTMAAR